MKYYAITLLQHPLPGAISGKRGTPIVMAASAYKTNSTVRGLKGVGRNVVSRDSNNQLNHSNLLNLTPFYLKFHHTTNTPT